MAKHNKFCLLIALIFMAVASVSYAKAFNVTISGTVVNKTPYTLHFVPSQGFLNATWTTMPAQTLAPFGSPGSSTSFSGYGPMDEGIGFLNVEFLYAKDPNNLNAGNCDILGEFIYDSGYYTNRPTCVGINAYTTGPCSPSGSTNPSNSYTCGYEILTH